MTSSGHGQPILYVFVVGFHHKKGCQIDYSYPPLNQSQQDPGNGVSPSPSPTSSTPGSPGGLPDVWRTLPSLALPDGAHNYDRDTIFFHLPDPDDNSTVYGVSCYRQIPADKLITKTSDVTRGTVQKSVVVLSKLPLYGLIAAKCEMITHAYFGELDFSKVDCLKELYDNLNCIISKDLLDTTEIFLDLSPRSLVLAFQHKILILFKLLLLEKKVLMFGSPVKQLCTSLLTLCSLVPGMVENGGLDKCSSSVQPKPGLERKFSGDIEFVDRLSPEIEGSPLEAPSFAAAEVTNDPKSHQEQEKPTDAADGDLLLSREENLMTADNSIDADGNQEVKKTKSDSNQSEDDSQSLASNASSDNNVTKVASSRSQTPPLLRLSVESCGLPLEIFRKGCFCHPYLSLTYLDVLSDARVRGFLIGATNFLFKQRRNLFNVIIDLEGGKIDVVDPELRKQLTLSTEDLRFAGCLVKSINESTNPNGTSSVLDGTYWEGGDEWLRYQFKLYMLHLLRTSECDESSREYASFNTHFMNAWKETHNYKMWSSISRPGVFEVNPGHPCTGQLSMADMKLKLAHAFNSEKGKKLSQTASTTGKAVSGAVTSAKSAVSTWWTTWKSPNPEAKLDNPPPPSSESTGKTRAEAAAASAAAAMSSVTATLSSFSLSSLLRAAEMEEEQEMNVATSIDQEPKAVTKNTSEIQDV